MEERPEIPRDSPTEKNKRKREEKKTTSKKKKARQHHATPPPRASTRRNPWDNIERIDDDCLHPKTAAIRKALRNTENNAVELCVNEHFAPAQKILEVAWVNDTVGWGLRYKGTHPLQGGETVGVYRQSDRREESKRGGCRVEFFYESDPPRFNDDLRRSL